jgi:hypothetical protein
VVVEIEGFFFLQLGTMEVAGGECANAVQENDDVAGAACPVVAEDEVRACVSRPSNHSQRRFTSSAVLFFDLE